MRESLASLLQKRWANYRKALKQCQHEFSEKGVHDLRVEIRRVLSTLTLLGAAMPGEFIEPIREALEDRLKSLSRLRDTQVQLLLVKRMARDNPGLEELQWFLRRQERRLVKRLTHELQESRSGKLTRWVIKLADTLENSMAAAGPARQVKASLLVAIVRAFEIAWERRCEVDAANAATIHRLRLSFKKFRYMVESFTQVWPGVEKRQLRAMHDYQTRMGEIQDLEVLLAWAKKFARKTRLGKDTLEWFRDELHRRRAGLMERFLTSADRLWEFRPRPSPAAARRRLCARS